MRLTGANVTETIVACLFKEGESYDDAIIVDGITRKFGLHPGRVEEQKENIIVGNIKKFH